MIVLIQHILNGDFSNIDTDLLTVELEILFIVIKTLFKNKTKI